MLSSAILIFFYLGQEKQNEKNNPKTVPCIVSTVFKSPDAGVHKS